MTTRRIRALEIPEEPEPATALHTPPVENRNSALRHKASSRTVTSKMTGKRQKTAIITGGGTGLGRALALRLAQEGYALGLIARSEEPLIGVCSEVAGMNGKATYRTCDVNRPEALQAAVDDLVHASGGRLDLLVINAAMIGYSKAERAPGEKVRQILETNIMGSVHTLHAALPHMLEQGSGHVVAISSLGAFQQWPGGGLRYYYTSKRSMSLIFGTYRRHLRSQGIHVSIMHPGWIETAMFSSDRRAEKKAYVDTPESAADKIYEAIRHRKNALFPFPLFLRIQRQNLTKAVRLVLSRFLG